MSMVDNTKTAAMATLARVLTALIVLWLTCADVLMHATNVLPGPCGGDAGVGVWYHWVTAFPAYVWWTLIQLGHWKLNAFRRWQTYAGWLIVILGTFPACRMASGAYRLIASGIGANWLLWLAGLVLISLVLAGKVTIWVYWWRIIQVEELTSRPDLPPP